MITVIPAQAGIQNLLFSRIATFWAPACAGVTEPPFSGSVQPLRQHATRRLKTGRRIMRRLLDNVSSLVEPRNGMHHASAHIATIYSIKTMAHCYMTYNVSIKYHFFPYCCFGRSTINVRSNNRHKEQAGEQY